jgi:D-alanine-D-alanine ligase
MKNNLVVFLYDKLPDNPNEDQLDVIRQMKHIRKALLKLGYATAELPFSIDISGMIRELKRLKPLVVFNLVETLEGTGQLLHIAPSILNFLKIPFTGVSLEALFITTNKILTKKQLRLLGIPTCEWFTMNELQDLDPYKTYIVKPISEDGSLGLDEHCVFSGSDGAFIKKLGNHGKNAFFIEHFIDGREFNLSLLGGKKGPQVMPPAEILFIDYPEQKPRMVGFNAKWTEDSFEYNHTPRTFRFRKNEQPLLEELRMIALQCWHAFELTGYVRVDFRVDKQGRPFVLEVNGNPCIAPESGYVAATKRAGLVFTDVIKRIMEDALR